MHTLKDVPVGATVIALRVNGTGAIRRRIMDMGITKGVSIHVRKVAPLGDPMELIVRGYSLSLRRSDAEMISVEAIDTDSVKLRAATATSDTTSSGVKKG